MGTTCSPRLESTSRLTDEFDAVAEAATPAPTDIVQRPNAVIRNGGPKLLQGLMLPLPPSANAYWINVLLPMKGLKFPVTFYTLQAIYKAIRTASVPGKEAKAYCALIGELALQKSFRFFTTKPLRMDVVVCPRDRREIDAHNYTKVLLDALEQAGVYEDDSQVIDLRTRVGPIIKGGRVVISLLEVSVDPQAVLTEAWQ
jgi:crossover junction endodeoxyribonuclease RusA